MITRLAVGSRNPVKLEAVGRGFRDLFPNRPFETVGISVPSGVSDQPMTDEETRRGAANRAETVRHDDPAADLCFGVEGGIEDDGRTMRAYAWIVAIGQDGRHGASRTAAFALPAAVAELVREGHELGDADDRVFGAKGSKQQGGAVGLLTDGAIDRTALYAHAVTLALIPFKRTEFDW